MARKNDVCFIFCLCGAAAKDEDVEGGGLDFRNVVIFDAGTCATQLLHPRIKGGIVDGILGFHLWSLALFVAPVTPATLYLLKTGTIF